MNGVFGDFSYGSYPSFFASSSLFLIDISPYSPCLPGESGDWRDGMEAKRDERAGQASVVLRGSGRGAYK